MHFILHVCDVHSSVPTGIYWINMSRNYERFNCIQVITLIFKSKWRGTLFKESGGFKSPLGVSSPPISYSLEAITFNCSLFLLALVFLFPINLSFGFVNDEDFALYPDSTPPYFLAPHPLNCGCHGFKSLFTVYFFMTM